MNRNKFLCEMSWEELEKFKKYTKHYETKFRDSLNINGKIKFGCEIEFNSFKNKDYYKKRIKNNDYTVKNDTSGPDIIEITTPILSDKKEDWLELKRVLSKIKHGTITPSEGGHIHFDHSIIEDKNLVNFLKLWYVFEDIIYKFSTGEYENLRCNANIYARKINEEIKEHIDLYEKGKASLYSFAKYDKGNGINLRNHLHLAESFPTAINTYEIRVPNGSLDINIWQNNVEFFSLLFKFADKPENRLLIDSLYKLGTVPVNDLNILLLADMLYKNEESKIRFLNQIQKNKQFNGYPKRKKWL